MIDAINIKGELLDLTRPKVMGIINVTPDSFYSGSRISDGAVLVETAGRMINEGADMLDIGGYSSRPGADNIPSEEELRRLRSALEILRKQLPSAIISVDTFRAEIADTVINDYSVDIINDISGGQLDPGMFEVIAKHKVPYVIMHMKGNPGNMQINPEYDDVVDELLLWFSTRKQELVQRGVSDIIIDPGFGFGKTREHNFILLDNLDRFKILELPLMAGLSRKTMIWKTLGITPDESLNGTTVLNTVALMNGASILRVHDVKEAVQAVRLVEHLCDS